MAGESSIDPGSGRDLLKSTTGKNTVTVTFVVAVAAAVAVTASLPQIA
jgi:hypothetical protein